MPVAMKIALVVAGLLVVHVLPLSGATSRADQSGSVVREVPETSGVPLQTIEGRVQVKGEKSSEWISKTRVVVDGGRFYGFLRANGKFQIHNVPPGSYLVEVVSANHEFEPARVDISSKSGKIRARKVDLLKTSNVSYLPYPLKFKVDNQAEFFVKRESWSAVALLKDPTNLYILLLVVLALPIFLLRRLMDPKYNLEEIPDMFQLRESSMPSLEETFTKLVTYLFGGGGNEQTASKKAKCTATKKTKRATSKKTKRVAKRHGTRR